MMNMTIEEMVVVTKLLSDALENKPIRLSDLEKETVSFFCKKMIDQRTDISMQQKERDKAIIDLYKNLT